MKTVILVTACLFFESALGLQCYTTGVAKTSKDELDNYYFKEELRTCPQNFSTVHQKFQKGTQKSEFWLNNAKNSPGCYKVEIRLLKPPINGEQTYILKKGCYPSKTCQELENFIGQEAPDLKRDSGIVTKCFECYEDGCNAANVHFTFLPAILTVMAAIRNLI